MAKNTFRPLGVGEHTQSGIQQIQLDATQLDTWQMQLDTGGYTGI